MRGRFPKRISVPLEVPGGVVVDRFRNERPGPPVLTTIKVFGWAITKVQETTGDSVLRTVDELQLYADSSAEIPPGAVALVGGQRWKVDGNPDNYDHNPWFVPGLVLVHCRKVEG